ncbi:MAG: ferredoxin [Gemmataceae bacterium]
MAVVVVNDREVEVPDDLRLNCIQVAARAGVEIPHYCWHPALSVVASCRMCLIEVGEKKADGSITMQPKLVPACQTPARHGTVIVSNSERVRAAQKATLEYLLLNHPLDCPVCDQAGECYLQDYSFRYGRGYSRLRDEKIVHADKDYIGDNIVLFTDRCIMCSRCVRFTREISGTAELEIVNRGAHAEIDIFPGRPCNNKLSGNVVDLCPVGALCSKDFLYKQRVWFLRSHASVCPLCSTGCSIWIDENKGIAYRIRPRVNEKSQGYFICDDGRGCHKFVNDRRRILTPRRRHGKHWDELSWEECLDQLRGLERKKRRAVLVLSPWLTCEEMWLAWQWAHRLADECAVVPGPSPVSGTDDAYPKGPGGSAPPTGAERFVIRAEKCPNGTGLRWLMQRLRRLENFQASLSSLGSLEGASLIVFGGYLTPWLDSSMLKSLREADYLAVFELFPNELTESADLLVPAATFAEKEGTFINYKGLAQAITRAIRPFGNNLTEGEILWRLLGRQGLYNASEVRKEMSIDDQCPLLPDVIPPQGVFVSYGREG